MVCDNIVPGRFIDLPNRFIAHVEIDGVAETCHVKNTSRLTELLLPEIRVSVQRAQAPHRKTAWDLIAALREAAGHGAQVLGVGCDVTSDSLAIRRFLRITL